MVEFKESERNPIGTEVIILKDCRRIKRANGKKGIIYKYIPYIIAKEIFPLKIDKDTTLNIKDLDEDIKFEMPVIKYSRFGKIRGDQCFWKSLKEYNIEET